LKAVNKKKSRRQLKSYFSNKKLQQVLIGIVTIALAVFIIENAAVPKKYKLAVGMRSNFDITAPRDIENTILTEKLAEEAAEKVSPVMLRLESVPIDIINSVNEFINSIADARQGIGVTVQEQDSAVEGLKQSISKFNIPLTTEQIKYLAAGASDEEMDLFDELTISLISSVMKQEVTKDNLTARIEYVQNTYQNSSVSVELKSIGSLLANTLIRPNSVIDEELTNEKRAEAYNIALENKQLIHEGSRIISYGDIVTADKLEVLEKLNLLETGKFDYTFAGGILCIMLIVSFLLVLYLNNFCSRILNEIKELVLLCTIILLTLVTAWILNPVNPLFIPIFIAPMLISILLDLRLGIITNLLLTLAICLITKCDAGFFYTAIIGGTCAAFIVKGASQRSRLSASGLAIAVINAIVIASVGLIDKSGVATIANNAASVAINGILSIIFTIGTLPFFESTFNIITPLKLLELANPNQPLMKKLLMEAPGTYHHSLMVGNLAEAATEEINGNALLARVGAYYHDVGKLKRPNFFKENQLSENPHDRMTPNLSTLVITSHTTDGAELAEKYKVPLTVRNIILQHHGTTLVAYFYYKGKKADKNDSVKQEDFRYQGPRPSSKEAAVVMLADSVEAAVRSMAEKTEGKMEGLIRKIIKDKLDDGQLDHCDLTLKDMDMIAKAFMRVFGGYFHEREVYPEMKVRQLQEEHVSNGVDPLDEAIKEQSHLGASEDKNDLADQENGSDYERLQA
jgi:putative nucleotidyltransferase with HDIG domain